jgi:hypothetical protein
MLLLSRLEGEQTGNKAFVYWLDRFRFVVPICFVMTPQPITVASAFIVQMEIAVSTITTVGPRLCHIASILGKG